MIELPSLHKLDQAQATRIWLATQATDMRCGFDRLAKRLLAVRNQDPWSGHPADKARTHKQSRCKQLVPNRINDVSPVVAAINSTDYITILSPPTRF